MRISGLDFGIQRRATNNLRVLVESEDIRWNDEDASYPAVGQFTPAQFCSLVILLVALFVRIRPAPRGARRAGTSAT